MDEYNKLIFAHNLDRYMKDNKTERSQICALLNVSKSTVSAWLKGEKMPRMDKVEALAGYFGIMKSDLIEEKPAPQKDELSNDKQFIIECVRRLSDHQAKIARQYMELLIERQNEKNP